jgi:hypothetical protein
VRDPLLLPLFNRGLLLLLVLLCWLLLQVHARPCDWRGVGGSCSWFVLLWLAEALDALASCSGSSRRRIQAKTMMPSLTPQASHTAALCDKHPAALQRNNRVISRVLLLLPTSPHQAPRLPSPTAGSRCTATATARPRS